MIDMHFYEEMMLSLSDFEGRDIKSLQWMSFERGVFCGGFEKVRGSDGGVT